MLNLYDILYGAGLLVSAPFWLAKPSARRKVLTALTNRLGHVDVRASEGPTVFIHAVSLGEINATRAMLQTLGNARPDLRFVISTTTDTGYARGRELYGQDPRVVVIRFPLDFSAAINRVLDRFAPQLVVLMELELWPNFMLQCARRGIAVLLVNGRLTAGSYRNYRLGGLLVRRMFGRLTAICAQEKAYADRFITLGAAPNKVSVTGTMKFDTAQIAQSISGDEELATAMGICRVQDRVWVCGSTGPGEEEILLGIYRDLLKSHPGLRLVLVPRKPERFEEVARTIASAGFELIRRSRCGIANCKLQIANCKSDPPPVILGDTMGELRKFYSLADVVFVGRTLIDLGSRQHGSDMIEPAALAKPTIVGPFTGNFAEVMNQFRAANAMREALNSDELARCVGDLLSDLIVGKEIGRRAQEVVRQAQGATAKHVELILSHLPRASNMARDAQT